MTTRIDMLNEWWENAEQGSPKPGDTIIINLGGGYAVEAASEYWAGGEWYDDTRILSRAPKPEPAWHGAVAVIASTDNLTRQVWERDGDGWYGTDGYRVDAEALEEVSPLIEAKVTDEMVLAALNASTGLDMPTLTSFKRNEIEDMRYALTAALGLETE